MVENESSRKLKCLRSNNGGEYCSKEFEDYCSTNDIHWQKIIPRTPQENGEVECMSMTIMEHARSMIFHVGIPLNMWVEVVNTIVYLINRGPSVFWVVVF